MYTVVFHIYNGDNVLYKRALKATENFVKEREYMKYEQSTQSGRSVYRKLMTQERKQTNKEKQMVKILWDLLNHKV